MKPSEFRSENHEKTFQHLAEQELHTFLPRITRSLITSRYHPELSISAKNSTLLEEVIDEQHALIIVANHVQKSDHHVMSAVIRDIPELDEFVFCNTVMLAKSRYFIFPFLSNAYVNQNCFPVNRPQDILKEKGNKADASRVFGSLNKAAQYKIDQNVHIAGHPEGTRNKGDWRKIGKIQKGIGHIASSAATRHNSSRIEMESKLHNSQEIDYSDILKSKKVSTLIMSIAYPSKDRSNRYNPLVRVNFLPERPDSPRMYTSQMQELMQDGLDTAYKIIDNRDVKR